MALQRVLGSDEIGTELQEEAPNLVMFGPTTEEPCDGG